MRIRNELPPEPRKPTRDRETTMLPPSRFRVFEPVDPEPQRVVVVVRPPLRTRGRRTP